MTIKAAFSLSSSDPATSFRLTSRFALLAALATAAVVAATQLSLAPTHQVAQGNFDPIATMRDPYGALVQARFEPVPPHLAAKASATVTAPVRVAKSPLLEIDPDAAATGRLDALQQDGAAAPAPADEFLTPLPPRRPQFAHDPKPEPGRRGIRMAARDVAPAPVADNRGLFERLFSFGPAQPPGPALAYARPDDGGITDPVRRANQMPMGAADGQTAVYDISARVVIMPNGEKLEAHSGLGELLDDPKTVHVKNKGATPPNVYELSPREQLFHGVPALRMTPVGGNTMYGRDGILAHTYMLGPNGDSNGCVSFKDYDRFLQAYHKGQVKRLIVVASRG